MNEELAAKGVSHEAIEKLQPIILLEGDNAKKLETLKCCLSSSEVGLKGIEEIETIFKYIDNVGVDTEIELDLTLARGLNYYTSSPQNL